MRSLDALLPPLRTLPAQTFLMGSPVALLSELARNYGGTRESYREESPQHSVALATYQLAAVPVTNALYAAYIAATGATPPSHWRGSTPPEQLHTHPVVNVSWHAAQACCQWLSTQTGQTFRLPTEAEWEHAARGTDGRTFPWGDDFTVERANTRESGIAATTPIGTYPAGNSPSGLADMAGNVWEWTASLDALYPYVAADGREDPHTPGRRILRGGCYANPHGFARCACRFRLPPHIVNEFIGFRLAVGGGQ
jgi:formylglycine-generating enzyme required for sulfatase activity